MNQSRRNFLKAGLAASLTALVTPRSGEADEPKVYTFPDSYYNLPSYEGFLRSLEHRTEGMSVEDFFSLQRMYFTIDSDSRKQLSESYTKDLPVSDEQSSNFKNYDPNKTPTRLIKHYMKGLHWNIFPKGEIYVDGKPKQKFTEFDRRFLFGLTYDGFLAQVVHPVDSFKEALGRDRLKGISKESDSRLVEFWETLDPVKKNQTFMAYGYPEIFPKMLGSTDRKLYDELVKNGVDKESLSHLKTFSPWNILNDRFGDLSKPDTNFYFVLTNPEITKG